MGGQRSPPFSVMTISEAKNRIDQCVAGFWAKSDDVIESMTPEMAEMQREQMNAGLNALGNPIGEYTVFTKRIKSAKGQPTDRVTLYDTGSFYDGIFVNKAGKELVFGSSDPKADKIVEKYGEAVFGLKIDAYGTLSEEWRNRIVDWINEKLQNG